jgi:hypothetical protein
MTTKRVTAEDAALCQRACQAAACAIQFCLQRHSYQEIKCTAVIDQYYDCCETVKRALQAERHPTTHSESKAH